VKRPRHARRHRRTFSLFSRTKISRVVAVVLVFALAIFVTVRLVSGPRRAQITNRASGETTLGASVSLDSSMPWPAMGEGAYSVPLLGVSGQNGPETPVPIASMTKIMTAYLVLKDHPIAKGSSGPNITVTETDQLQFDTETRTNQANVIVQAGEVLSEYQMLEGLLVHSANDLAYALAVWDAGSLGGFVTRMNATAKRLGMYQTHFADASGDTPATVSTPSDILKVAAVAMTIPLFATLVTHRSVTLPYEGLVSSFTPLLGTPGVVGVKSGYTTAAGGCDVLAYQSAIGTKSVVVLAAVTGQRTFNDVISAGKAALALAQGVASEIHLTTALTSTTKVATATTVGQAVPLELATNVSFLGIEGQSFHQRVEISHPPVAGTPKGVAVGVDVISVGTQVIRAKVVNGGVLGTPSLWQRLW